jgi:hypothetical protein
MLYGYRKDKLTTVVTAVANNNYAAYEAWFRSLQDDTDLVVNVYETNFMDHFSEEYSRAQSPVFVISHPSDEGAQKFIEKHEITLLKTQMAWDRHDDMVKFDAPDYYDISETRTIEELEGLDQNDPYDRRTDDEKAEDAAYRAKVEELKKSGQLSGDGSFTPRKPKEGDSEAHVTDIRTTRNADGTVSIDNVLAVKDYSNLKKTLADSDQSTDDGKSTPST